MKKLFYILISLLIIASCGNSSTIGKYKKEALPNDFSYTILKDKSSKTFEKNEMTIEINKKINVEQIATLADKLSSSKRKQRRFYIFYMLPGMKAGAGAWAISHFDPELEVQIIGSTIQEDSTSNKLVDIKVDGDIIGKWHEEQYTSSNYMIFKKDNSIFIKTIFKSGEIAEAEIKEKKLKTGVRYDHKDGGYNGEYYILTADGTLEFYNNENKKFTTATPKK